eukprot:Clim_evm2s147 gene=Clim_evmTU2s147
MLDFIDTLAVFVTEKGDPRDHHGSEDISWLGMLIALSVMVFTVMVSWLLGLGFEKKMTIGTVRAALQLTALGYILTPVFTTPRWWAVMLLSLAIVVLAAREAYARPKWSYALMFSHILFAIAIPSLLLCCMATLLVVKANPFWDPQHFIPLLGMLLGNVLTGVSLALSEVLSILGERRQLIEYRLAMGATCWEAYRPLMIDALVTGMTPTLNSMYVIGLVSIPGMMTGQILGGTSPEVAAKYQIVIIYFIGCTGMLGQVITLLLLYTTLIQGGRVRHELLSKRRAKLGDIITTILELSYRYTIGLCLETKSQEGERQPLLNGNRS